MEARITDIREVTTLPVEALGSGVYLVEDDGIEYIVDPGGCSCGGGRRAEPCEHMEAADDGACGFSKGALAYQYLVLDTALGRLVEAREILAAAAMGELSEEVHELVEAVEEEADLTWTELWGGPLELVS